MNQDEDFSTGDPIHDNSPTDALPEAPTQPEPLPPVTLAQQLLQAGQAAAALAQFNQLLEHQEDETVWYSRGLALADLGRYEEALHSYNRSLELQANPAPVWRDRGLTLYHLGRYRDSITSLDKALELAAADAQAWYYQGRSWEQLGRYRQALSHYQRAIGLDPNLAVAWQQRSRLLWRMGCSDEALAGYDYITQQWPQDSQAWRERGRLLFGLKQYDEAVASYDQAQSLQMDLPTWVDRGLALQRSGQLEAAIASYDQALQAQGEDAKIWYYRGLALRKMGRYDGAIVNFNRALQLRPAFYAATRSRFFTLLYRGHLLSYLGSRKGPLEQERFRNDLQNVFDSFVKLQLPTLVAIGLTAVVSTQNPTVAILIAAVFLVIATVGDWIDEARK